MNLRSAMPFIGLYRKYRLNSLLAELTRRAGECESAEGVYREMEAVLRKLVQFDRIAVRFVNSESNTLENTYANGDAVASWDVNPRRMLSNTATEAITSSGEPLIIADCREAAVIERFPNLAESASQLPSMLGVPVIHRGVTVGAFLLRSRKRNAYSEHDLEMLRTVASYIAPTVVNTIQLGQLQKEVRERTILAEISRSVSSTIDFGLVWDEFVQTIQRLMPCNRLVVALLDEDGKTIVDRYVWGIRLPNWDENPRRGLRGMPSEKVLDSKNAKIISMEESDRFGLETMGYRVSEKTGLRSAMFAPLIAGDRVVGTLNVKAVEQDAYSNDDLALFELLAMQVGGSVAAAELHSRTVRLAEEKAARVEIEQTNRRMVESDEARTRFIAGISHELRTPLTSIISFADIIRRNKANSLSEKDIEYLDVIRRNSQRLRVLIEDLLDLYTIAADDLRLKKSAFTVQDAIDDVVASVQPSLDDKLQKLVIEFSEPAIHIETDRDRLDQILFNLVLNAIKYSKDYSEIKIAAIVKGNQVCIAVIDHGIGMSEDEIPVIFDEFGRLENEATKSNQGKGLGLAVSRRLARALGGDIRVTSEKGKGSVFLLVLPAVLAEAA